MTRSIEAGAEVAPVAVLVLLLVPAAGGIATAGAKEEAGLDAKQLLERSDEFHYFYTDSHIKVDASLKDKNGDVTLMTMEVWEKGQSRLIQFLDPPEVAGMAVLVKDPDTIYVYEPEFNKVRRIASHAKKQTMLGSDYTFDEMATKKLSPDYDAEVESEDGKTAVLWLELKPGKDKVWPKIRVTIDKTKHWMATKLEYHDSKGKKKKTETRGKLSSSAGHSYPSVLVMTDHGKKHSTTNVVKLAEYDTGLPDEMFTKRFLVREE